MECAIPARLDSAPQLAHAAYSASPHESSVPAAAHVVRDGRLLEQRHPLPPALAAVALSQRSARPDGHAEWGRWRAPRPAWVHHGRRDRPAPTGTSSSKAQARKNASEPPRTNGRPFRGEAAGAHAGPSAAPPPPPT